MGEVKLEKGQQKRMKGISKAIYIIAKIVRIALIIATVAVAISAIVIPIIINNIKIADNKVEVFGEDVASYEIQDKIVTINDINSEKSFSFNVKNGAEIQEFLNKYSTGFYTICGEILIIDAIAILVLVIVIFNYIEKLFRNIYNNDTPFTLENVKLIKRIAIFLIVLLVVQYVIALIILLMTKIDVSIGFGFMEIILILGMFALAYIFQYGYKIQEDSKGRMYGEEDE